MIALGLPAMSALTATTSPATGVFTGPINGQDGEVVVAEGESLDYTQAETMDFFVEGVTGTIE